ncbi:hypothetical protein OKIT_0779 [Oenococcus kitaharae DSM 17330]|uniref:Uncharacterized protein n=1 Tax=Oenococcus kitaharae DSM 17330 TaxID=1045004 RepID=G9WI03_9LACO|nr:hypothetical protein OKIT_0779 [Oenococcus kitaharae DSM 17330]
MHRNIHDNKYPSQRDSQYLKNLDQPTFENMNELIELHLLPYFALSSDSMNHQ